MIERIDLLLALGEELDHATDGLGGVDRVQRREDEVARLGSLEGGLRGLGVAELADHDRVRVLAERPAQRLAEALGVEPDLALVDDRLLVGVEDLERVLDRHDVRAPRPVDVVEHRREGRRLARACRAGDEDEPAVLIGQLLRPHRGSPSSSNCGTSRGITRSASDIAPRWRKTLTRKRGSPVGRVGQVEVAGLVELVGALRRLCRHGARGKRRGRAR